MDLAGFIAQMRHNNRQSLRDIERLSGGLDHAYVWRLEKGDKGMPSAATIERLAQALRLSAREAQVLRLLAKTPIEDSLCRLMLAREDLLWEDVEPVAMLNLRGNRPDTEEAWLRLVDRLRDLHQADAALA
jgi:HTH-type transcriptional regulator, competence development regulator